jgi:hypothetical protein
MGQPPLALIYLLVAGSVQKVQKIVPVKWGKSIIFRQKMIHGPDRPTEDRRPASSFLPGMNLISAIEGSGRDPEPWDAMPARQATV